jgi:hypothetical protein
MASRFETLKSVLPQEILEMSETETACEYCGISYLILNKCEKMQEILRQMEEERASLRVWLLITKEYVEERPSIMTRLESLQAKVDLQISKDKETAKLLLQSDKEKEDLLKKCQELELKLNASQSELVSWCYFTPRKPKISYTKILYKI